MLKKICPGCKEVILCSGDEISVRCLRCETIFRVTSSVSGNEEIDKNE